MTGQDIRRSMNILKRSLCQPLTLPHIDDDGDEEMEVDERAIESLCVKANQHLSGAEDGRGNGSNLGDGFQGEESAVDTDVNMEEGISEQTHKPDYKENIAASLHRGLDIIDGIRKSSALRQSAFRFSYRTAELKSILPVLKVDVGVQYSCKDSQVLKEAPETLLCINCKNEMKTEVNEDTDGSNMQLALVDGPESTGKPKQVPKAVEKVLAGSFRREMALEEFCAKQASEIAQLNRLVKQYKHERECNAIIAETKEDKIIRLESFVDGVLPPKEFMQEELASLNHEYKLLKEKYENHPELLRVNIELKKHQDELEQYRNFFEFGEREVLLEEIQDLRCQLQYYIDSSSKSARKNNEPLLLKYSCEPEVDSASTINQETGADVEEKLIQEKLRWSVAENKWISLAEELGSELEASRSELEASRSLADKLKQELDTEKKCSEDLKEAMQLAMEGHARMLEQYADLEEKHMEMLARQRKIQDGIEDVKRAAAKAGVRGAESKFINSLAAEISTLKVQRERERQQLRNENRELQAQLRDTAEALQAAGELLARLKEAEEAVSVAQKRALAAEKEAKKAYTEMEALKGKHKKDIEEARNQFLREPHLPGETSYDAEAASVAKYDAADMETANDEQWRDEFKPFYDKEGQDDLLRIESPTSWFSGYDRCNI